MKLNITNFSKKDHTLLLYNTNLNRIKLIKIVIIQKNIPSSPLTTMHKYFNITKKKKKIFFQKR